MRRHGWSGRRLAVVATAALAAAAFSSAAWGAGSDLVLVSRATGTAGAGGNGTSVLPAVSTSGSRVAFTSRATNLTGDTVPGTVPEAFVRNVSAGTVLLASRADGISGAAANALVDSV